MRNLSLLALAAALASCTSTGVVEKRKVVTDSPLVAALLNPHKLTPEARAWLESEDLLRQYEKDPAAAIGVLKDRPSAVNSEDGRVALAELCSKTGDGFEAQEPAKALAFHLTAARLAFPDATAARAGSGLNRMRVVFNHSTGKVAEILIDNHHPWSETKTVDGPLTNFRLRTRTTGSGVIDPAFFDELVPAEYLKVKGIEEGHRVRQAGIGSAMVGHRDGTPERQRTNPFLANAGMALPVTTTLGFSPGSRDVELVFHDTLVSDTTRLAGRTLPLEIDFTAPLVTSYNYVPKGNFGWKGMLHPDEYAASSDLVLFEPFRPDQIPVVLVHGLMSSPETWTKAINALRSDPVLRENYQILAFYYPTGFPISYSAAALRKQLADFRRHYDPHRRNPKMRRTVVIGHSMGGMLTNMQIRNSGDQLEELLFTRPFDEIEMSEAKKAALRELIYFDANPDITRAVFVAAPHRGSDLATDPIGKLGSSLIRIPANLIAAEPLEVVDGMTEFGLYTTTHRPDGVNGLRPRHPFFMKVLELPTNRGMTKHSIIGDHHPDKPLEESSDMVVPYWSSHLDNVSTEKVVHATHTTITGNGDAIEEMRRILHRHLGRSAPKTRLPVTPPKSEP